MKGSVRWDEAKLAEIEANKPVRQKIDEPKTPYHPEVDREGSLYSVGSTTDYAAQAEAIRNALEEVISNPRQFTRFAGWTSSEDEADAMEQDEEDKVKIEHEMSFKNRRRKHYDEFWKVKEPKEKGCFPNDDKNDDEAERQHSCSLQINGSREIHIDGPSEILRTIDIQEVAGGHLLPKLKRALNPAGNSRHK